MPYELKNKNPPCADFLLSVGKFLLTFGVVLGIILNCKVMYKGNSRLYNNHCSVKEGSS